MVLRTVGEPRERFVEDALRILRAVRISAELNFTIDPKTLDAMAANSDPLAKISKERIRAEFVRIQKRAGVLKKKTIGPFMATKWSGQE